MATSDVRDVFFVRSKIFLLSSPQRLTRLLSLKEHIKPFPDRRMVNLLTFDNFFRPYDILAKTRCRMTTAIMNDAGCSLTRAHYLVLRISRPLRRSRLRIFKKW